MKSPTFTVTQNTDMGQVNISFDKNEWAYPEDHDDTLIALEPIIMPFLFEQMTEHTYNTIKYTIQSQLDAWVIDGKIYQRYDGKWMQVSKVFDYRIQHNSL